MVARVSGVSTDKRVVERMEDERGNSYAVDHSGGGGAVVIVVGVAKAAIGRDDFIVEVAQAANGAGDDAGVNVGKKRGFAAEAAHQAAQEMPLVDAVGGLVQGRGAGGEIDGGANGGDGCKRRARAPLARQLEREIAAHRVTHKRDSFKTVALGVVLHHRAYVARIEQSDRA